MDTTMIILAVIIIIILAIVLYLISGYNGLVNARNRVKNQNQGWWYRIKQGFGKSKGAAKHSGKMQRGEKMKDD